MNEKILTSKSCDYDTFKEADADLNRLYDHVKEQGYVLKSVTLTYDQWDKVYHMSISWSEE